MLKNLFLVAASALFVGSSVWSSPSVTLAWNANTNSSIVGYTVHYGNSSGSHPNTFDAGFQTTALVTNLSPGQTYFFVVTAYNSSGMESPPSNEASYQVPMTQPPVITLTSPLPGSIYVAPAVVSVAAGVIGNGHVINAVQFYSGGNLLGEVTSPPYSLNWSNVAGGNYNLVARSIYDFTNSADSAPINITVSVLPPPWQTCDIGAPGLIGSAIESNGTYTVQGAGNIGGTADNFRLIYQTLSGDGEIRARINSVGQTGSASRIGVVMRESLAKGAKYVFMGLSSDGTLRWQRRTSTGANTSSTTADSGTPPNIWVRLVRTGGTFYGYKSVDGTNWTRVSSRNISMAANIYFGLAVASGSTNGLNNATFVELSAVP